MTAAPLALLCAVDREAEPLLGLLIGVRAAEIGRKRAYRGKLGDTPVIVFPTGMGKVNAAQALTALLEGAEVRGVVGFGVAGAYPGSGLEVGDVALASEAVYGDEGVETPAGWIDTEAIGIPLLERDGERRFNRIPLDAERVERARGTLDAAGVAARVGPFVTVSRCSGTDALGREQAGRWAALCETMEGAAWAHVAALYGVPFLELRAVSNRVEDRDPAVWRIDGAAQAAANAARVVAAAWRR